MLQDTVESDVTQHFVPVQHEEIQNHNMYM